MGEGSTKDQLEELTHFSPDGYHFPVIKTVHKRTLLVH